MQVRWALLNLRMDREDELEDMEWRAILDGSFVNPELAGSAYRALKARAEGGSPEELEAGARRRLEGRHPEADPDVRSRILSRAGVDDDDLMTLGEISEGLGDDG